jgi:tetratricopeptide (TPR) repeat protein
MNRAEKRRQQSLPKKAEFRSPAQLPQANQQSLDLAVQHHTAGRLLEAEGIYQQILQVDPDQPIALHLLGVIAYQRGKNETAVELINKALTIKPDFAEAYNNLGLVLETLGRRDDAINAFHKVLGIKPDYANAHNNLGLTLQNQGKLDEAIASYHKAIAIKPDYADALGNLGGALQQLGKPEEAVASYHKALAIDPGSAGVHNNLGNTFKALGRLGEALESFNKALAINPNFATAHFNLHSLLLDTEGIVAAIKCLERAVELRPNKIGYRFMIGILLDHSNNQQEAINHFRMVENGTDLDRANQDAWRYIKSSGKNIPPIVGTQIQAFKLGIDAAASSGLVLEFGVRFGASIRQISSLVEQEVHGFDSFEGLPEAWHHEPKGSYSTKGVVPSVQGNVRLHIGWFEETLPNFIQIHQGPVRFINFDCDTYNSTKTVLDFLSKQITQGTVMVFDEYIGNKSWREDEFKAFQEAVIKYGWEYEYLCFSFMTKQVVVRIN